MKKTWIALLAAAAMLFSLMLPVCAAEEDTDASAEDTGAAAKSGELIYEETFDYEDEVDTNAVLEALGWVAQTKADGAYSDPSAALALTEGRLLITGSSDTYYLMLDEEKMAPYADQTITIQYNMEYTTASNTSRYFCVLANYSGQYYNSFHFRNGGNANNQSHYAGSWKNYDAYNSSTDAYAAATDAGNGSSVAMKLLGKTYNSGSAAFSNVPVTVRYVLSPTEGISVYMKLAEQPEGAFVLVSVTDPTGDAVSLYRSWDANAICFKVGGAQNGYVDSIAVWTGNGNYPQPEAEEPATTETEEQPTDGEVSGDEAAGETEEDTEPKQVKVKEPQTIVNKIAVWAVALFGGWIIWKKGKEQ